MTQVTTPKREPTPNLVRAALAGMIAGAVMSIAMMVAAVMHGESIWMMPNLISAMWLGPGAASGGLGVPTLLGFLTHEVTSAIMGVVAVPFIAGLSGGRVLLASLAYSLASYPLVFSLVLRWANPSMYERAPMVQMTWGHLLFGAVFAPAYLSAFTRLHPGRPTW